MEEILHYLGYINLVNTWINYQAQMVSRISEPSTVAARRLTSFQWKTIRLSLTLKTMWFGGGLVKTIHLSMHWGFEAWLEKLLGFSSAFHYKIAALEDVTSKPF